jgi:hypothetical protein
VPPRGGLGDGLVRRAIKRYRSVAMIQLNDIHSLA